MDVAVLGTSTTGHALAAWCLRSDAAVRLYGDDANAVMDSVDAVQRRAGREDAIDGTTGLEAAVGGADVVFDLTGREIDARRDLLAEVEALVAVETLLVVGDTSDRITAVAAGLRRPGRALGIHVVDPAESRLVELVVAEQTTADTRDRAVSFVESLDTMPIVVRDTPGFATTRLDLAAIVEAVRMVEEGVASVTAIDRALELGRDHPIGPLGLADRLGLDTVLSALETLALELGGRFDPPDLLFEKVEAGDLGRQTGTGFYEWENGERVGPASPNPTVETRSAEASER
ncbi:MULTISPECIES: 3-hydroxyacyl-CoA dehydrogenase family protein [Halomicrobium]|uniref:3-hydroxyacyl-CoA dehydrogenase domain protein n=2 Tax=Halomicrobium mukohataei TaxID=57705 RepID=C7NZL6_HALMD|nr:MULTISPECIES: 3-hydroxyacyl-CoA dehydrogenase family protein [Halomicrobium]ACV48784.1 3-hydroxyacyl-CoA dehydrogenase domain protein [Halomicrobium mukohataei DSM 12286]QCD64214.1 3-hydroxyacyl-CoA dehydrogenase family protein [Halomicrobium mukohataei]QFR19020.1 3-hydroxyacyl-CoA dehydrogenase family protein [Halomicrobium sp. ZPS1]